MADMIANGKFRARCDCIIQMHGNHFTMRQTRFYILLLMIMLLITIACNLAVRPYQKGDTLILDDFSERRGNWSTWQDRNHTTVSYFRDGLIMVVDDQNRDILTTHVGSYRDVVIEATAQKQAGPDDNTYGLVCRYQDVNNYYAMIISSDGYYGIVKVIHGAYHLISGSNLNYDERIKKGTEVNLIKAECKGSMLLLAVNGEELASIVDGDLKTGRTGLITGTYGEAGAAILFDNFTVKIP